MLLTAISLASNLDLLCYIKSPEDVVLLERSLNCMALHSPAETPMLPSLLELTKETKSCLTSDDPANLNILVS